MGPATKASKKTQLHAVPPPSVEVSAEPLPSPPAEAPAPVSAPPADGSARDAHELLQEAYGQLSTRKQMIESELTRIEDLRREHETITAQLAALEQAVKVFQQQERRQAKTA